jgi:2-C-methyl-D-erythritol 4-phosphate cytidylyltransferase
MTARACAVVVAGGVGERFGRPEGKQFVELCGMPVVCWAVRAADSAPSIDALVVVAPQGRADEMRRIIEEQVDLRCELRLAEAGATRQESVLHGLACVPSDCDIVAIHDGARPLVRPEDFERCIERLRSDVTLAGAIASYPCTDTLKFVEGNAADAIISSTPDRSLYWCAQTPQVFWTSVLRDAHEAALREGYVGTDDASLVEHSGGYVACINCGRENVKVTLPEDLVIAEALMKGRL